MASVNVRCTGTHEAPQGTGQTVVTFGADGLLQDNTGVQGVTLEVVMAQGSSHGFVAGQAYGISFAPLQEQAPTPPAGG